MLSMLVAALEPMVKTYECDGARYPLVRAVQLASHQSSGSVGLWAAPTPRLPVLCMSACVHAVDATSQPHTGYVYPGHQQPPTTHQPLAPGYQAGPPGHVLPPPGQQPYPPAAPSVAGAPPPPGGPHQQPPPAPGFAPAPVPAPSTFPPPPAAPPGAFAQSPAGGPPTSGSLNAPAPYAPPPPGPPPTGPPGAAPTHATPPYAAPPPPQPPQDLVSPPAPAPGGYHYPPAAAPGAPPPLGGAAPPPSRTVPPAAGAPPGAAPPAYGAPAEVDVPLEALTLNKPALGANAGKVVVQAGDVPNVTVDDYVRPRGTQSAPSAGPVLVKPLDSKFIRSSLGAVPNMPTLLQKYPLPFGMVLHPLADEDKPDQDPIPVVNFASVHPSLGVIRCRKCRTYINPYVQFTDAGRKWQCCVCRYSNDVPQHYYSPLDANGVRQHCPGLRFSNIQLCLLSQDIHSRPELTNCSVELLTTQDYMTRPPQRPGYIFIIDVSMNSVQSGYLDIVCNTIADQLPNLPGDERTIVGVITVDVNVHFYNLRPTQAAAKKIVVPELAVEGGRKTDSLEDVMLPLPDDLFVLRNESLSLVTNLLRSIPTMFRNTTCVEKAFGPALSAALKLMSSLGGKLCIFLSGIPSIGVGRLKNRDDRKLYGTPKEVLLLRPSDEWYRHRSLLASKEQVGVELFVASSDYVDTPTLGQLTWYTGGQVFHYKGFTPAKDQTRLVSDITRVLTRHTAFESVMRIRVSNELRIKGFYGHFLVRGNSDLLALPNVDPDKSVAIIVQHQNTMIGGSSVCVQSALLYTSSSGERRIRVHTLSLPVTAHLGEVFRGADQYTTHALLCKIAVEKAIYQQNGTLDAARKEMMVKIVDALKVPSLAHPAGTLAGKPLCHVWFLRYSEEWFLDLPLSEQLNPNQNGEAAHPDDRFLALASMMSMNVSDLFTYTVPHLQECTSLLTDSSQLPVTVPPSSPNLDPTKSVGYPNIVVVRNGHDSNLDRIFHRMLVQDENNSVSYIQSLYFVQHQSQQTSVPSGQ
eukprot:gene7872-1406_t